MGTREMIHWLRSLIPFVEDTNSVPSIHIRKLTAAYNSSSRVSNIVWPLQSTCTHIVRINLYRHTYIHIDHNKYKQLPCSYFSSPLQVYDILSFAQSY